MQLCDGWWIPLLKQFSDEIGQMPTKMLEEEQKRMSFEISIQEII